MYDLPCKAPAHAIVCFIKPSPAILAGIIKIPKQVEETYETIICTPQHTAIVQEIMTILGENNVAALALKASYLLELETKIEEMHPLKFMTSIFCYPHLHEHMVEIFSNYFKRTGFMRGLAPRLTFETQKGALAKLLPQFAEELAIPLEKMQPFFDRQEWEGLCRFIIDYKQ